MLSVDCIVTIAHRFPHVHVPSLLYVQSRVCLQTGDNTAGLAVLVVPQLSWEPASFVTPDLVAAYEAEAQKSKKRKKC